MKKIIIALVILIIVGLATYYFVFTKKDSTISLNSNVVTENPIFANEPGSTIANQKVEINNMAFNPTVFTIKVGTKIIWTNKDAAPHTVTSDADNILNSSSLATGESYAFIFNEAGTFPYHCSIHPTMKAKIVVVK